MGKKIISSQAEEPAQKPQKSRDYWLVSRVAVSLSLAFLFMFGALVFVFNMDDFFSSSMERATQVIVLVCLIVFMHFLADFTLFKVLDDWWLSRWSHGLYLFMSILFIVLGLVAMCVFVAQIVMGLCENNIDNRWYLLLLLFVLTSFAILLYKGMFKGFAV